MIRKGLMLISVTVLVFLLAACSPNNQAPSEQEQAPNQQEQTQQEVEVVPSGEVSDTPVTRKPREVVAPVPKKKAIIKQDGLTQALGDRNVQAKAEVINTKKIECDLDDKTLSFRIKNVEALSEGRLWSLDLPVPNSAPQNTVGVQFFINGYFANSPIHNYYMNSERMFGPTEKFSDNCNRARLRPRQRTTCSLTNVPLRSGNQMNGYNTIFVNTPKNKMLFGFYCE